MWAALSVLTQCHHATETEGEARTRLLLNLRKLEEDLYAILLTRELTYSQRTMAGRVEDAAC